MGDTYPNFAALAAACARDDYSIVVDRRQSEVVIAAPHGGGIEPGTSEIAVAIAGSDFSCYRFEGRRRTGNGDLHITSTNFDEPTGLTLMRQSMCVLTVHGEGSDGETIYLGGRHTALRDALRETLKEHGYEAREHQRESLQGLAKSNICNVGRSGGGVQLELSEGLRRSFFQSLSREGRTKPNPRLEEFSKLVRNVLRGVLRPGGLKSMTYEEIAKLSEQLTYRDKLRLAQLLIQVARKEEEEHRPEIRAGSATSGPLDPELIGYVADRLRKLKPAKKETVLNSIGAMFQFQGGVSDADRLTIFSELLKERHITIGENGRVQYPHKT